MGGDPRRLVDLAAVGKRLPGQRLATEQTPPAFLQIQPTGTGGHKHLLHPWMLRQPCLNRRALVTGEIVRDERAVALRIRLGDGLEQLQLPSRVARARRQGQRLSVPDP